MYIIFILPGQLVIVYDIAQLFIKVPLNHVIEGEAYEMEKFKGYSLSGYHISLTWF